MTEPIERPKRQQLLENSVKLISMNGAEEVKIPIGWDFDRLVDRVTTLQNYTNGIQTFNNTHQLYACIVKRHTEADFEIDNARLVHESWKALQSFNDLEDKLKKLEVENKKLEVERKLEISQLREDLEDARMRGARTSERCSEVSAQMSLREKDLFKLRDFLGSQQFNAIVEK